MLKKIAAEFHYRVLCLSNVLFAAGFVSNAVLLTLGWNFTTDDVFAGVFFPCYGAFEFVLTSHKWAELAFFIGTESFPYVGSPNVC